MLHKTALLVASLAASLTLAIALALAGFAPGTTTAPAATAATAAADAADVVAPPPVQVDKVYVAPPEPQKTVTVHKVVASGGGENESEGSGGDD
jgi:hypothetical protein